MQGSVIVIIVAVGKSSWALPHPTCVRNTWSIDIWWCSSRAKAVIASAVSSASLESVGTHARALDAGQPRNSLPNACAQSTARWPASRITSDTLRDPASANARARWRCSGFV